MIGFEYSYNKPSEIINDMKLIGELSLLDYGILVGIIFGLLIFVYYIIPYLHFVIEKTHKSLKKKRRKKLIHSIALQKDIEEEIETELDLK